MSTEKQKRKGIIHAVDEKTKEELKFDLKMAKVEKRSVKEQSKAIDKHLELALKYGASDEIVESFRKEKRELGAKAEKVEGKYQKAKSAYPGPAKSLADKAISLMKKPVEICKAGLSKMENIIDKANKQAQVIGKSAYNHVADMAGSVNRAVNSLCKDVSQEIGDKFSELKAEYQKKIERKAKTREYLCNIRNAIFPKKEPKVAEPITAKEAKVLAFYTAIVKDSYEDVHRCDVDIRMSLDAAAVRANSLEELKAWAREENIPEEDINKATEEVVRDDAEYEARKAAEKAEREQRDREREAAAKEAKEQEKAVPQKSNLDIELENARILTAREVVKDTLDLADEHLEPGKSVSAEVNGHTIEFAKSEEGVTRISIDGRNSNYKKVTERLNGMQNELKASVSKSLGVEISTRGKDR